MEINKYKQYWCRRCRLSLDFWWLSNRRFCPFCRKQLVFNLKNKSKGGRNK